MLKILAAFILFASPALAQMPHTPGMQPGQMLDGQAISGGAMGGMGDKGMMPSKGVGGSPLSEPGQSAFATLAEVVRVLKADPGTDWSTVNINALREHLQDMDAVTLDSATVTETVDGGLRFNVTGDGRVTASITRMVVGHAAVMDGVDGWGYSAEVIDGGAALTVSVPPEDLAQLKGLGFYGLLASGGHHQPHHWLMATGKISG